MKGFLYAGLPRAAYVWDEFGCEEATKLSIVQKSMSRAMCQATYMALSISKGKVLVFTRGVLLPSGALLCWAAVAASGSSSSPVAVATSESHNLVTTLQQNGHGLAMAPP